MLDAIMKAGELRVTSSPLIGTLAAIEAALNAAEERGRTEERERLKRAWARSWDCSADPDHAILNDALRGKPEDEWGADADGESDD